MGCVLQCLAMSERLDKDRTFMAESIAPIPLTASRAEQIFPTLTADQLERLAAPGRARSARAGEVLVELGDKDIPVFVVISGELEVVRPSFTQETLIRIVGPGNFTGEINTLSGRRAFARIRARQDSEVIEIDRESLLALVQTDADL